jgi:hypothetical protein
VTGQSISREQVISLLARVRAPDAGPPPESIVNAWVTSLAGYSLGECEAAMLALGPAARTATPSVIAGSIDNARDRTGHPTAAVGPAAAGRGPVRWERETARARHRDAGWRGIHAVYAAMGWHRDPGTDQARARRCPFCRAAPGVLCGPLSRNRAGHREQRDPATRMHPSRLTTHADLETTR